MVTTLQLFCARFCRFHLPQGTSHLLNARLRLLATNECSLERRILRSGYHASLGGGRGAAWVEQPGWIGVGGAAWVERTWWSSLGGAGLVEQLGWSSRAARFLRFWLGGRRGWSLEAWASRSAADTSCPWDSGHTREHETRKLHVYFVLFSRTSAYLFGGERSKKQIKNRRGCLM